MAAEPSFRYSAHPAQGETNTSHALVLDLVGRDRRVLDVGCATGYLAEALAAQGNKVSGVEIDPEAAEAARPYLDRLVVGDVEQMDLVDEFGAGAFDVVVFADVLEHLKDPAELLRRARPLLADDGFAVLSIPNVAHGAVRLALMRGRFDYRPTGLLDDTHLRFFTRDRLEGMLADAGFVAIDSRQTTAGLFETEIPLRREDYPDDVVAEVESDPDSRVYQFVLRADPLGPLEPVDGRPGGFDSSDRAPAEQLLELQALRRTVSAIAAALGAQAGRPVIGVVDASSDPAPVDQPHLAALGALRTAVAVTELRRRLAGFDIRAFTLSPVAVASGLADDVVRSLAPWGPRSVAALRAEVDAVVVLPTALSPESARILAEMEEGGLRVRRMTLAGEDPDPLVLAARLADPTLIDHRRTYLAVTGLAPAAGGFALCVPAGAAGADLDQRLRSRPVVRPDRPLAPVDLLGLVGSADLVVTDSPAVRALATGLGRPVITGSAELAGPTELDGYGVPPRRPDQDARRAALASLADRTFDDLHHALLGDAGTRLAPSVVQRLAEMDSRVATLEAANAGLRRALGRERLVMAAEVRRREGGPEASTSPWSSFHIRRLHRELGAAHARMAELQREIDRIYATRTMRAIAPARRLYGRLRRTFPG